MAYDYDRKVTAAKKPSAKELREDMGNLVKVLKTMDDYLFDGMKPSGASKALGVLATAERLVGGLRKKLESASESALDDHPIFNKTRRIDDRLVPAQ